MKLIAFCKNGDLFRLMLILFVLAVIILFSIGVFTIINNQSVSIQVFANATKTLRNATSFSERREFIDTLNSFYENSKASDTTSLVYTFMSTIMIGAGLFILDKISKKGKKLQKKANTINAELEKLRNVLKTSESRITKHELLSLASEIQQTILFLEVYGNTGKTIYLFKYNPRLLSSMRTFIEYFNNNRTRVISITQEERLNYQTLFSSVKSIYSTLSTNYSSIYTQIYSSMFNDLYQKCTEIVKTLGVT